MKHKHKRRPNTKEFNHRRKRQHFAKSSSPHRERDPLPTRIVGIISETSQGWSLRSTSRKERSEYKLHAKPRFHLENGQLVVAELTSTHRHGPRECKLLEIVGHSESPRAVSLISLTTHDIPHAFPKDAVDEAEEAKPVGLEQRVDLRKTPLITIDGEDARDFDDAVFAEPAEKGWHLIVAIADVAHYVRSGSALDRTAYERGNSVYFPDRVVPMLPEALSNELCSLKPHVDRACLAVHLWLDEQGELIRWQFVRGVMRSHARLTYQQVQEAAEGNPNNVTAPLLEPVIRPLYAAYRALIAARLKRGTLELDLPERKVLIREDGTVDAIKIRERYDSHKLIEEFMITANVAAAAQLEGKGGLCLYRVHDKPSEMKLEALRDFLDSLGISLVPAKQLHPRFLTQILENSSGGPHAQVINEMMLRSQAQAVYSPDNIGHFGLALAKYAHFTSPIRRYADLVVHRGLIRMCKLGDDGLTQEEMDRLEEIGDHISNTERRAAMAERDAIDRYITLFLIDRVGATFPARISGVARFGLFARLNETGADGIIPISTLPEDYYFHDEKRQALVGRRTKRVYQLAQPITVRLEQADRLTGSMSFSILETGEPPSPTKERTKPSKHTRYPKTKEHQESSTGRPPKRRRRK